MTIKTNKFRQSARGEDCTIHWAGHCNGNPETTVVAHIGWAGIGTAKRRVPFDANGVFACSSCHDVLDGRVMSGKPYRTHTEQMERRDLVALVHSLEQRVEELERERDHWFYSFRGLVRTLIRRMELKV